MNWKTFFLRLGGQPRYTPGVKGVKTAGGNTDKRKTYVQESGVDTPLQAEFTGDKLPSGGDSVKKELASWKSQAAAFDSQVKKEVPKKSTTQREFGSPLMTPDRARVEQLTKKDEIGLGAEPAYVTGGNRVRGASRFSRKAVRDTQSQVRVSDKGYYKLANVYLRCPDCGYNEDRTKFIALGDGYQQCPMCDRQWHEYKGDGVGTHTDTSYDSARVRDKATQDTSRSLSIADANDKGIDTQQYDGSQTGTGLELYHRRAGASTSQVMAFDDIRVGSAYVSRKSGVRVGVTGVSSYGLIAPLVTQGSLKYVDPQDPKAKSAVDNNMHVVTYVRDLGCEAESPMCVTDSRQFCASFVPLGVKEGDVSFTKKQDGTINISVEEPLGGGELAVNDQQLPVSPAPRAVNNDNAEAGGDTGDEKSVAASITDVNERQAGIKLGSQLSDEHLGSGVVTDIKGNTVVANFNGKTYETEISNIKPETVVSQ